MNKLILSAAIALSLMACGGQAAHAANTDLFADQNSGRLYTMADVAEVYAPGNGAFTIKYADGTSQLFSDNGNTQIARITGAAVFQASFAKVASYAPAAGYTYFNTTMIRYAACSSNALSVGFPGFSSNYYDAGCTAFNNLKAGAN